MPYDNLTQLFKRSVFRPDMAAQHGQSQHGHDHGTAQQIQICIRSTRRDHGRTGKRTDKSPYPAKCHGGGRTCGSDLRGVNMSAQSKHGALQGRDEQTMHTQAP